MPGACTTCSRAVLHGQLQSSKVLTRICNSGHTACPMECSACAGGVQTWRVARHFSKSGNSRFCHATRLMFRLFPTGRVQWGLCIVVALNGFSTGHNFLFRLIPHLDVLTELTGDHNKQARGSGFKLRWVRRLESVRSDPLLCRRSSCAQNVHHVHAFKLLFRHSCL